MPKLQNTVPQSAQNKRITCEDILKQCEMFSKVPPEKLSYISKEMKYRVYSRNDILLKQGEPSEQFFLLESGGVRRTRHDEETGKMHSVEYAIKAKSINSMKIISGEPVYATTKCDTDQCKVYEMQRSVFLELLKKHPEIATHIAEGLCDEIRRGSRKYATPLLQQQQQEVNIPAVSIAAGIESYYRSALNARLNARLTGVKAKLFPNMHIQVPTRVAYICGFKALRTYFDQHIDAYQYQFPTAVQLAMAVSPGIIMTPISSLLEASNAGHMNNESMATRWMRGLVPRAGREMIFGLGLNQMSDYFEERMEPFFDGHKVMANAAGSLMAGIVSGYLSHVPHNMSTFKLLHPSTSYKTLYDMFIEKSVPPVIDNMVQSWPSSPRYITRAVFATLFPRGVMIRTTQIVGSFIILNGTINYLQMKEHHKIQQALGV